MEFSSFFTKDKYEEEEAVTYRDKVESLKTRQIEVSRLRAAIGLARAVIDRPARPQNSQAPAMDEEAQRAAGIGPGLLRLSVGIEHEQDLLSDLRAGLDRAATVRDQNAGARADEPLEVGGDLTRRRKSQRYDFYTEPLASTRAVTGHRRRRRGAGRLFRFCRSNQGVVAANPERVEPCSSLCAGANHPFVPLSTRKLGVNTAAHKWALPSPSPL